MKSNQKQRTFPFIKVCGIQNESDAEIAIQNGANAIGLLVGLTHKAEDKLSIEKAHSISKYVRKKFPDIRLVMVTHLLSPKEVALIAKALGVTSIQIHDDMTPKNVKILREKLPQMELIKAIHIEDVENAKSVLIAKAEKYVSNVDAFITDSKSVDADGSVRIGGTGKRHDSSLGRALVEAFPHIPVIIAGGLNPDNVENVIKEIQPAGIDANSGLENADGSKSSDKVRRFIEIAVANKDYFRF